MNTLVAVLIVLVVIVAAFWIIDQIGFPAPIGWVVKAIVGLIGLVAILSKAGLGF